MPNPMFNLCLIISIHLQYRGAVVLYFLWILKTSEPCSIYQLNCRTATEEAHQRQNKQKLFKKQLCHLVHFFQVHLHAGSLLDTCQQG